MECSLTIKKKGNSGKCCNIDKLRKHYAKCNKSTIKIQIPYNFTAYMKYLVVRFLATERRMSVAWGNRN